MFKLLKYIAKNDNHGDISFVDVKAIYDEAYAEKAKARVNLKKFQSLIKKAEKMDMAYRAQLTQTREARFLGAA